MRGFGQCSYAESVTQPSVGETRQVILSSANAQQDASMTAEGLAVRESWMNACMRDERDMI